MHVEFAAATDEWGGWVFGDLAATVCRAVEVVGPAAKVLAVTARELTEGPAHVTLQVGHVNEVLRLREEAVNGEYVARFRGRPDDHVWEADVNGIRLLVSAAREEEP